jgi:hypothetical protein
MQQPHPRNERHAVLSLSAAQPKEAAALMYKKTDNITNKDASKSVLKA